MHIESFTARQSRSRRLFNSRRIQLQTPRELQSPTRLTRYSPACLYTLIDYYINKISLNINISSVVYIVYITTSKWSTAERGKDHVDRLSQWSRRSKRQRYNNYILQYTASRSFYLILDSIISTSMRTRWSCISLFLLNKSTRLSRRYSKRQIRHRPRSYLVTKGISIILIYSYKSPSKRSIYRILLYQIILLRCERQ